MDKILFHLTEEEAGAIEYLADKLDRIKLIRVTLLLIGVTPEALYKTLPKRCLNQPVEFSCISDWEYPACGNGVTDRFELFEEAEDAENDRKSSN